MRGKILRTGEKRFSNCTKSLLHVLTTITSKGIGKGVRIDKLELSLCPEMFILGTNCRPDFLFGQ